ncbi:prolyl oligopeptidase family serine peptidase [Chryseobacterium shigense]|uniref:prolyl oligopeptidase n=1 Tax=Chryseobacterium shigense TaxID=297244 RepID=A0A841N6S0_9FLAO|nr:prolyl oligopeptidase family serine peptidase [Chryseobacterium shigense]MBB6372574.1 prolyl oligopeptidase [Chryseobacterium shigense]
MRILIFIITSCFVVFIRAQKSNPAPSVPANDDYHGVKILDEYRNLENLQDLGTINWMKSQTNYANSILDKIPNRNYYQEKRLEFDKRQGYSISDLKIARNNKYFYLKRNGDEKIAKLYYREGFQGKEEMLYDPADFISADKTPDNKNEFIINYISPDWEGNRIAISLSKNGKEISEIIIMDVKGKHIHPEIITNTEPANVGGVKWLDDNSGFFYSYFLINDSQSQEFYKNTKTILYKLGTDPKKLIDVFSSANNPDLKITEEKFPIILDFDVHDKYYVGMLVDYEDYRQTFIIKKQDLLQGRKNWKPLYNRDDKVRSLQVVNNEGFFLSRYNNTPNYKLCKTNIENPDFKNPEILIPEKKDEVIKAYNVTKDGIYYTTTKNGIEAKLYLYKDGKDIPIHLPYISGSIDLQSKGKDYSDIWVTCSGWANDEQRFRYNQKSGTFSLESLVPIIEYPEFKDVIVEEITVKARDGEEVPLSLIYSKNLKKDGKNPVLIDSYGSYGTSNSPYFAKGYMLWALQGGITAIAHVRGGGEKGEKWRLGGFKETKPNTWRDLIDCTEYLIKEKYTSKDKVAIWGVSAGGITVGRAMTERPDLFKAVILEVGMANAIRDEISANNNAKEFGTVKDPKEFKALLEMDAYHHIKKGVKYPSTLITGGINDERVAIWEPVKFAAKLMASDASANPVLLKVDYEGGHGGNVSVEHAYSNLSDIFAFALWQLGNPDYQPKENIQK